MSTEQEALRLKHTDVAGEGTPDFGMHHADFSRMSDRQLEAYQERLASYVSGHIADLRDRFNMVRNSPEADRYSTFFDHVADMKAKGEPAYALMFETT